MPTTQLIATQVTATNYPTIGAGSNRLAFVAIAMYNGSGNVTAPATCSVGGVAASFVAGDAPSTSRENVTLSLFVLRDTQCAAASGGAITVTGGSGTRTNVVFAVKDAPQTDLTNFATQYVTSGGCSMTLTRVSDSYTWLGVMHYNTGALTLTNPSQSYNSGRFNAGEAVDTARTASATVSSGGFNKSAIVINIPPLTLVPTIVSVNGGAGITAGSTGNTAQLSGYSSAPNASTIGPLSLTNLSYNSSTEVLTFDCPSYADGATWPLFDATATFTVANGSQSADLNSTPTNPPADWTTVTISSPNTTDPTYIGYHTDISNHEIVYDTKIGESVLYPAEGLVIATDGGVSLPSDLAGDHIMYKRNLTTGVITQLTVTINDASEVVSVGGLTSIGLTSIGLVAVGLTSVGL